MTTSFDHRLDKAFHGSTVGDLLEASPEALTGVSPADAQKLDDALRISSIRKMASDSFFSAARAILAASGAPRNDPGPPPDWDDFFAAAPLAHYEQHVNNDRFRLEFGPVYYRGRLDGSARVIVVGQDPSTNEILAHRVFIGRSGQRVQGLLSRIGIIRSYSMLNTFLYSVRGQFNAQLRGMSEEPEIMDYRNAFLDRLAAENPIEAVIATGAGARHAVEQWPGAANVPVFGITHPAADDPFVVASWNDALPDLIDAVTPDDDGTPDPAPYMDPLGTADLVDIPRFDMPFGVPDWHGVDSGHSTRDGNDKIVWNSPLS